MKCYVFSKPDCVVCAKAKSVLDSLNIPYVELTTDFLNGYKTLGEAEKAMALFSAFGWTDHLPLVAFTNGGPRPIPLRYAEDGASREAVWDGREIADKSRPWTPRARAAWAGEGL